MTFTNLNETDEVVENFSNETIFNQQNIQSIILFMFNLFEKNIIFKKFRDEAPQNKIKTSFKIQNVDFFDSILNEFYKPNDVVKMKKDVYYKNVYFFVKRIKDVVIMCEFEKMQSNLSSCLRKTIQIWYIEDLKDFEKKLLNFWKKNR